MMRLLVVMKKELLTVVHDYPLLVSLLVVPLILGFLVKLAIGPLTDARLIVADPEQTGLTTGITNAFLGAKTMVFQGYVPEGEVGWSVQQGSADVGLVFPANFTSSVLSGGQPSIRIVLDDSDPRMYFNMDIAIQYIVPAVLDDLRTQMLHSFGDKTKAQATFAEVRGKVSQIKEVFTGINSLCIGPQQASELGANLRGLREFNTNLQSSLPIITSSLAVADPQSALEFQQRAREVDQTLSRMEGSASRFETLDPARMQALQNDINQLDSIIGDMDNFVAAAQDPSLLVFPLYVQRERARSIELENAYVPIMVPFIIFLSSMLVASQSVMKEKLLTLERLLTTPLSPLELLLGKFLVMVFFEGVVQGGLLLVLLQYLFGFVYTPASHLVLVLTACFSVGLGILTAAVSRNSEENMKLIGLLILLMLFFGGVLNPINMMDDAVKPFAQWMPLTKAIHSLQDAMLRGIIGWEAGYLALVSGAFLLASILLL